MAVKNVVETKFTVNDKITKRFSIMAKAAARFGRGTEKAFKRASRAATGFKSVTGGIVAGLGITSGLRLASQAIGSVVTGFLDFEKAARGATVRFKDIGPEAANFNQRMKEIRTSAREAGATTEFTAAQAAQSLDFLARAGFTSAEAMGSLASMIDLATATGEEFASVADMSSDLMGAFGLAADTTAQKINSLNRLNDVLVKTANSANVTVETMFETMKDAAPVGRKLGIELEEVAALTAVLGNAGIKGTKAATALKNSFLRLSTGGKPITQMLDSIGVKIDDGSGNMRKFTDILEDVGAKIKGLGTLEQSKILDTLFGKRAIAGAANLTDSIGQIREFEKTLKNAGDTSKKTAEIMRQSLQVKLDTLISTATEFGFRILEAFEVKGAKGIDSLTAAIKELDPQPVISFFEAVAFGVQFIWEWRNAIFALTGVFFVLKILLGLATAISVVASLNPFGLMVLGVTALITAVSALFIWVDPLIAAFDSMPLALKAILSPLRLILGVVKALKTLGSFVLGKIFGEDESQATPGKAPATKTEATGGRTAARFQQTEARERTRSAFARGDGDLAGENGERVKTVRETEIAKIAQSEARALFSGRLDISGAGKDAKLEVQQGSTKDFDVHLLGT